MLKGRGRDPRGYGAPPSTPAHLVMRPPAQSLSPIRPPSHQLAPMRPPAQSPQRVTLARPEPDYEVVDFPGEQYVNAKLQPPPPPPPRPPTGHPPDAGASCGLCGGGGARVRCAECGRRALCASCDDMYHRHPKRRNHQRQALSQSQLRDERPPLPPKVAPPVPPPRRHKVSGDRMTASPRTPMTPVDQRRATLGHMGVMMGPHTHTMPTNTNNMPQHTHQQIPLHLQAKLGTTTNPNHIGSMPFLPTNVHHSATPVAHTPGQTNTLNHMSAPWNRQRGSLQGFNVHPNMQAVPTESWENPESMAPVQNWGRPLRRGASVLELGGAGAGAGASSCAGCAQCATAPWRYASCASLDHAWPGWPPACCTPPHPALNPHTHPHSHMHPPQTPQPYRRAVDSRAASRAGSRAGSRAASPAMSVRSRTSRRTKHRTPSPPPLPSSDADSESESESDHAPTKPQEEDCDSLGPAPPPPNSSWQCEHCTFVNEPGVRVCAICCRTPTTTAKTITADITSKVKRLKITRKVSPPPAPVTEEHRVQRSEEKSSNSHKKERTSTGCGPSPPREGSKSKKPTNRLVTPTREQIADRNGKLLERHDMAVGPSPPREAQFVPDRDIGTEVSPPRDLSRTVRVSPYRDTTDPPKPEPPKRHNISVGPSPPRDCAHMSVGTSPNNSITNVQKKSAGTSPPREIAIESRCSATSSKTGVSNTGTSPPPQSISTQTYEVPTTWERAPSVARSRPRRRFRDESRRERSHSRHSLSSDTRESDRSVRTAGPGGRWEWRERDSSPENYSRLSRRASHLDLRRTRPNRRSGYYGSEAASPDRQSTTRAISLEALAGGGARRETERGIELAQLMSEAEQLGFSAAEVQAALTQSPAAPLAWLRSRWASLCAGVRAAAERLAPGANVPELEARAALARHRGAMWPAVTECVERHRRQTEALELGPERRLRGRVWGSPAGADDEAAPRLRAEDSSDEFEVPTPSKFRDDDWMYLPLDIDIDDVRPTKRKDSLVDNANLGVDETAEDLAKKLKTLLRHAGVPSIDENLLLKGLLSANMNFESQKKGSESSNKPQVIDLIQSENDFIDAYNALTRSSPLPNINDSIRNNTSLVKNENKAPKSKPKDQATPKEEQQIEEQRVILVEATTSKKEKPHNGDNIAFKSTKAKSKNEKQINVELIKQHSKEPENVIFKQTQLKTDNSDMTESEKRTTQDEIEIQSQEKSINLNDIVGNTQRLIQQMKEEINSDINSIDGRTTSHSDTESSSNEEQESSYSDTEGRTSDGTTFDEKEVTSSEEEEEGYLETEKETPSMQNRTSSEDNDKFEEALDHVEIQLEDFKHANIEMLDTIARSLREEHTATLEIYQPKLQSVGKQDLNNNLFTSVNTFEEIYEELSSNNTNDTTTKVKQASTDRSQENTAHYENIDLYAKQTINISVYKTEAPNKILILETVQPTFNATIEDIEEETTEGEDYIVQQDNYMDETQYNLIPKTEQLEPNEYKVVIEPNRRSKSASPQAHLEKVIPDGEHSSRNLMADSQGSPIFTNETEEHFKITERAEQTEHIELNTSIKHPDQETNNNEETEIIERTENLQQIDNIQEIVLIHTNEHDNQTEHIEQNTASNHPDQETNYNEETEIIEQMENLQQIDNIQEIELIHTNEHDNQTEHIDKTENNENSGNNIPFEFESKNDNVLAENEEQVIENIDYIDADIQHNNRDDVVNNQLSTAKDSPLKSIVNSSTDGNNHKIAPNKSNIPKLVKNVNNKAKIDKNAQKLNVSKVPVRRASAKQYPAPAPPKSHFGNIQSGHVKQLQTRLFNSKTTPTKPISNSSETIEVIASTSTLNKKKQAPAPPIKHQAEQQFAPAQTSTPPKEKKQFFRETCRTEDEWTDSDSEDSQVQAIKPTEGPSYRLPSPPPPITVRRVSGQLIDLARIQLPEGSPERQARMLLAEGATETWEQAQIAVELVSRGADPPAALLAALECADLPSALAYLYQDCELCASRLPEHEMVSMLRCTHRCCRECAHHYFTVQITERSIADCVCPYCKLPELESLPEDSWLEYFAHLDILLKTLLETDVHELFQRKLRDRTLAREPNFRWCMECSSGFFVHPKQKKIRCPECRSVSCASCRKTWTPNHEGLTCEQYTAWLEDNDPERSVTAIQQHLRDNGLECPRCHFKYSLSRGGCMHFTCTQCKYEFCYGCGKPFTMGARCGLSDYCAKLGLHAHHPRNCLFYLRDKEPHELQTLLQMNNITYETEPSEGSTGRCPVQLQRETPTGLIDGTCGCEAPANYAGLCKPHYIEYLAGLARAVDPLPIMNVTELVAELRRRALPLPERGPWDTDPIYAGMCAEIVKEKIPLD